MLGRFLTLPAAMAPVIYRRLDGRRIIAGVVTIVLLVAVIWVALYAAREDREPPRVVGRVRERRVKISTLEPLAVEKDPTTGEMVVVVRDRRGRVSQLRLPPSVQSGAYPGGSASAAAPLSPQQPQFPLPSPGSTAGVGPPGGAGE